MGRTAHDTGGIGRKSHARAGACDVSTPLRHKSAQTLRRSPARRASTR
ncbi:MAG: hypothetical protein AVDCRST_MAG67-4495 [uncultured Solirubrobacteraceae bacterium]|uniref:Uncharacterized protein n=1 Tax=uncultured Solirubrobacteraceae bacterium TaxID=1162706 RepID=A0A6J4TV88_9ACTN|nr:MAG: hypothetical protein AVDCRST_MAG67-4495 [uncultured Solirubrobacteraceae bacterium]